VINRSADPPGAAAGYVDIGHLAVTAGGRTGRSAGPRFGQSGVGRVAFPRLGALQAGALGYLTKDATRAEIGRAVLAAAAGQAVLDPEVQQRLLSAAIRAPALQADHDPDELTPGSPTCCA
jgi:hypothetical protein